METRHGRLAAAAQRGPRAARPAEPRGGGLFSIREVLDELLGGSAATALGLPASERLAAAAERSRESRRRDRRAVVCG